MGEHEVNLGFKISDLRFARSRREPRVSGRAGILPAAFRILRNAPDNDWRDEEPGRMLHEAHTGPLAALNYNPRSRYYGGATFI